MGVTGDFAALRHLSVQIGAIAGNSFREELGRRLGAAAITQVVNGFRGQRDPYGNPWKELKYRKGQILRDTGRLANSYSSTPTETGFRLFTNVIYAGPHQFGSRKKSLPRRQMVPDANTGGIGAIWGEALNAEADRAMRKQVYG